jgi:hypothetical protein
VASGADVETRGVALADGPGFGEGVPVGEGVAVFVDEEVGNGADALGVAVCEEGVAMLVAEGVAGGSETAKAGVATKDMATRLVAATPTKRNGRNLGTEIPGLDLLHNLVHTRKLIGAERTQPPYVPPPLPPLLGVDRAAHGA